MTARDLDLSYKGIVDLENLVQDLLSYKHCRTLNLRGNKLRSLPSNLAFFKEVYSVDLAGNPIVNLNLILKGLGSLPKLHTLCLDLPEKTKERWVALLLDSLPGLKVLNGDRLDLKKGKTKKEEAVDEAKLAESVAKTSKNIINEEDIENYSTMVECFKYLYSEVAEEKGEEVSKELSGYFKNKLQDLGKLDHSTLNFKVMELMNLRTLFKVYLFSLSKVTDYVNDHLDPRPSKVLQFIHNTFSSVFDGMWDIVSNGLSQEETEKNLKASGSAGKHFRSGSLNFAASDYFTSNKKMHSSIAAIVPVPQTASLEKTLQSRGNSAQKLFSSSLKEPVSSGREAEQLLMLVPKKMTFLQVEELVTELIQTKLQSDVNHLNNRLPKKTMEAHMNEVFMNKFGVKKVVLENIQSFLYYLKYYSYRNSKFKAFYHVLRNDCEEEYMQAHKTAEKTLAFLLKLFINGNNPYMTESKINEILKKKMQGKIEQSEALMVIEYLYNKHDAGILSERVKDYILSYKQEEPEALTREAMYAMREDQRIKRIEYKAFNWIVTDYLLESHLKFLEPFVRVFRSLDEENTGYIDEFRMLIKGLNPDSKLAFDVEDILVRIDPYGFNQISFSTSACFISEMIIDDQTQENILENLE